MSKRFQSLNLLDTVVCGLIAGSAVFFVYWLFGGDFERGYGLGFTCMVFIALWVYLIHDISRHKSSNHDTEYL